MSDNFNINGYNIESQSVYETLQKKDFDAAKLAKIDKNGDKTISEDELQEFEGGDFEAEDDVVITAEANDDRAVKYYRYQQERAENELDRNQKKLYKAQRLSNKYMDKVSGLDDESELKGKYQSKLSEANSEINSINSAIMQNMNTIGDLQFKIRDALKTAQKKIDARNAAAETAAQIAAVQSGSNPVQALSAAPEALNSTPAVVQAADNNQSVSAPSVKAQSGSGANLMSVTGDLSICLDRVGESLGSTRQGAADYITTLCNKITGGKISPKIILSQIFSESSGKQNASTTANSKYVGLGQMGASAVQAVNNKFGTNFSFKDMDNAAKNLEAMVYFMELQYERYGGDIGKALTAYNTGNCNSGVINNYARKIMARA